MPYRCTRLRRANTPSDTNAIAATRSTIMNMVPGSVSPLVGAAKRFTELRSTRMIELPILFRWRDFPSVLSANRTEPTRRPVAERPIKPSQAAIGRHGRTQ